MSFEGPPDMSNAEQIPSEKPEEVVVAEQIAEDQKKTELSPEEQLGKLMAEKEPPPAPETKKEITPEEKERLIKEEKEKILKEKLGELFIEFEDLDPKDLESIIISGKTSAGIELKSMAMGTLDQESAKTLGNIFKEGLTKIVESMPELLKMFDNYLTKEATERVEKRLEEEKNTAEKKEQSEISGEAETVQEKPADPVKEDISKKPGAEGSEFY